MKRTGFQVKKRHILVGLVGVISVLAVFGDKGLVDVYRLRKELQGMKTYNRGLEKENSELEKKIELLKSDKRYIEHIARKELGMVGKNEIVYKFDPPEEKP